MEKYIGKCLDSLLIPELDQVEVLVVNDGSKDCSSEIAHEYANRFPNSIRVIDKENGNYGSCINAALPQCTGRYVKILDADDTFDTTNFSIFVQTIATIDVDALITPFIRIKEGSMVPYMRCFYNLQEEEKGIKLDAEESNKFLNSKLLTMHSLAYNTDVFRRFSYHQTEGISYTDTIWAIVPSSYCNTFMFLDIEIYRYLIGREGQTTDVNQVGKLAQSFFRVAEDLLDYYQSFNGKHMNRDRFLAQVCFYHKSFYRELMRHVSHELSKKYKSHDSLLKKEYPEVFDAVRSIRYSDELGYKIYSRYIKKGYPDRYCEPKLIYYSHAILFKLKRLFK